MPADTTVKFFSSSMTGAPVMTGLAGSLLAVLQACLVDGFGLATVDSVVVASGVATVTRAAGHPFVDGQVALLAGSTPVALNGEKKVTVISATKYSFDATGVSDGTATGTITHKVAPLGWANPFASSGNVGVFKPTDAAATACVLRVDDSGTKNTRVVGYESMTDLNTGASGSPATTGVSFPTNTLVPGGLYWPKSQSADATQRPWYLFGDGRGFYLCSAFSFTSMSSAAFSTVGFGDIGSVRSVGGPDCIIAGPTSDQSGFVAGNGTWELDYSDGANAGSVYFPRSYTNVGSPIGASYRVAPSFGNGTAAQRSGASGMLPNPNGPDGGIYVSQVFLSEPTTRNLRGNLAGLYFLLNSVVSTLANPNRFSAVANLAGRQVLTLNSATGAFGFDITGPWQR